MGNTIRHRILHRLVLFFLDRFPFLLFVFESTIKHRELSLRMLFLFFLFFFCLGLWSPFGADFYSLSNLSADPATKKREQKIPLSRRIKIFKETSDPEQKKKKKRTPFLF